MREKSGFVATSILYSFFLVFITLFVVLIANYMHNQILVKTMNDDIKVKLSELDDKKLSDLKVGEYIKFGLNENISDDNKWVNGLFDNSFKWILVDTSVEDGKTTLTFLSDVYSKTIHAKIGSDRSVSQHYISVDIFNQLNSMSLTENETVYNPFKLSYMYDGTINFNVASANTIKNVSRSNTITSTIKNKIFQTNTSYIIYDEENDKYINYLMYGFSSDADENSLKTKCQLDDELNYKVDNLYGYKNVVEDSINNITYINYCNYPENISSTASTDYNLRLTMKLIIDTDNNYISGGHGTNVDPYLFMNGVK